MLAEPDEGGREVRVPALQAKTQRVQGQPEVDGGSGFAILDGFPKGFASKDVVKLSLYLAGSSVRRTFVVKFLKECVSDRPAMCGRPFLQPLSSRIGWSEAILSCCVVVVVIYGLTNSGIEIGLNNKM